MQGWTSTHQLTTQHSAGCSTHAPHNSEPEDRAWTFWTLMLEIYSNRWTDKNGSAPSDLWIAQIGSLTSDRTMSVCNALVARCKAGNSWPPDLAEFVTLVADCGGSVLGLKTADVMDEYWQWRNESYKYASTEEYFIARKRQPVLYLICTEIRRWGVERQMTAKELEMLAAQQLAKWEAHAAEGKPIPPIRKQIAAPRHAPGPTPAQLLKAKADAAKLRKI